MKHEETKLLLTPDGARQLLEDDLFESQRSINKHHIRLDWV